MSEQFKVCAIMSCFNEADVSRDFVVPSSGASLVFANEEVIATKLLNGVKVSLALAQQGELCMGPSC